jgi:hypothetical protein
LRQGIVNNSSLQYLVMNALQYPKKNIKKIGTEPKGAKEQFQIPSVSPLQRGGLVPVSFF